MSTERVAWYNGALLPESQVRIPFRDLGFTAGDAVYDTARTFGGEPFMVEQHVDRLLRSLDYVMIDIPYDRQTIIDATYRVAAENRKLLRPNTDYWVAQRVSSGVQRIDGEPDIQQGPTFIIEAKPIPMKRRAKMYRDGADAVIASQRRIASDALSANAKTTNLLNISIAKREIEAVAPGSWALLLDQNGHVAEGAGCNVFFVRDCRVVTPCREHVLPGFGREVTIELCAEIGVECSEEDITLFDAATSQEAFLTATSLCILPLRSLNGRRFDGVPGPVTARLMDAFKRRVDMDYVAQYLAHL